MAWDEEAKREYAKRYYRDNREKIRKASSDAKLIARQLAQGFIIDYLSKHPCIDCGEDDIIVLEFDHVDRSTKKINIANAVRNGMKLVRLEEEVAKCVVRCANCHRRKTYEEMGHKSRSYPHQR